jgi:hypothetical protein
MISKEKVPKNVRRGTLTSTRANEEKWLIWWRPDDLTVAAVTKIYKSISAERIKR